MITVTEKINCCGCSACKNICPKKCITMAKDAEGFSYPSVNTSECRNCGLCEKVCPLLNRPAQHEILGVYGAKNKDTDVRRESSSGGMFSLIAEKILEDGGTVFGAALDNHFHVRHIGVTEKKDLALLRGSKYVQSDLKDTFQEAKQLIMAGKKVLFSGTPCQVAGLYGFFTCRPENLFTVDCVCHGVPSPKVYEKHIKETAALLGSPVTKVKFRDKTAGWKGGETLFFAGNKKYGASKRKETYMRLFLNNVSIRPSCSECAFNNRRSLADLTIGDYWGIDKHFPDFDDDIGVTLILLNTERGREMFESIKKDTEFIETDFAKGAEYNLALAKPLPLNAKRDWFFKSLGKKTLSELAEEILGPLP